MRRRLVMSTAALLVVGLVSPSRACAHELTVVDGNSSITVQPHALIFLHAWVVDGTDHMKTERFFFRRGTDTRELGLARRGITMPHELPAHDIELSHDEAGAPNHAAHEIHLTFEGPGLKVDILYALVGGRPGGHRRSAILESIELTNTGSETLALSWFPYTDLDVKGTKEGDVARGDNFAITQEERPVSITVGVGDPPAPNAFQIAPVPVLFEALEDTAVTNLNNTGSPSGPGDIAHAFQWNLSIPSGEAKVVELNKILTSPIGCDRP